MRRRLVVVAAVAACLSMLGFGLAEAASTSQSLNPGDSVSVGCSGPGLSWAQTDATDGVASCAPNPTTTTVAPTTTTVAPTTTTVAPTTTTTVPAPPVGCPQFIEASSSPFAFCDTLGVPANDPGTRTGSGLDPVLWGVSRSTGGIGGNGTGFNWPSVYFGAVSDNTAGLPVATTPNDVQIENGYLVDTTNDSGGQIDLAMYPRQPFDFAGRTGTVEFDVSDNTQGIHGAWPTFVISDQPVPAPYGQAAALDDNARNSIGVDFNVLESGNPGCLTASIWSTANYVETAQPTRQVGCVQTSAGLGHFNHVEVQVNGAGVSVYMSNPDSPSSLKLIATSAFTVPLTRGVVWLEDVHYNGNKFGTQQTNSLSWRDLAFDGPVLPRDLGYDVLDNTQSGGTAADGLPVTHIGFGSGTRTFTWAGVRGVENAGGALLVLTYWPTNQATLTYSVNGGATQTFPWPYCANCSYVAQSVALPVNVSQLHDGMNTITLTSPADVANLDLILQGAGGVVNP